MKHKNLLKINLLKNKKILSEKDFLKEKKLWVQVRLAALIFVAVLIGIVGYYLFLNYKLNKIENGIVELSQEVDKYADATAKQIYLKKRLNLIITTLEMRTVVRQTIQELFSIHIPGVVIGGLSFEDERLVKVQFIAEQVFSLDKVLIYLKEQSKMVVQVVSHGITRNNAGGYQLQVSLTLAEETQNEE